MSGLLLQVQNHPLIVHLMFQMSWSGITNSCAIRGPEVTVVKSTMRDLPGGPVVKNLPANARDMGSVSGQGRFHMPRSNKAHVSQPLSARS